MAKITVEVTPGHGVAWWTALSPDQKRAVVFPRLKAKESNKAIGESLGITPNSIASLRDTWNKGRKRNPFELVWLTESTTRPELTPVAQPEPALETTAAKPAPLRFSTSEATDCDHRMEEGRTCGYVGTEQKLTGKFCALHAHLHK